MSAAHPICLLWDASHIWGLMAWRAVRALGLPCRLVKGKEIAEGAFLRKQAGTALLLVPGGSRRRLWGPKGARPSAAGSPKGDGIWAFAAGPDWH